MSAPVIEPQPDLSALPEGQAASESASVQRPAAALSLSAIGLLCLINGFWSFSSVASKNALAEFGPFTLALLRFLPSGLLLYTMEWKRGFRPSFPREDLPQLFALGILAITFTYGIFYLGVAHTSASDTSLLFACEPLLIALFAALFLRERLRLVQWGGLLLGLGGIALIAGRAGGNLLALLGLMIECSSSVLGKRLSPKYRGLSLASGEMLIGSLFLIPFVIWECVKQPPHPTLFGWMNALYLCLICSAFCYGVWYRLLEKYPVSTMGAFILAQPLFGPLWGWLFRGETLKPASALGGVLVVAGLVLTSLLRWGSRRDSGAT